MDVNYELYKVFYFVATTLSFSEASKQLFISQSAVSQSIKALEKKLDQTLFIRSTKRVRLTPEGEILLRHVEPAMNLIKRTDKDRGERHHLPVLPGTLSGKIPQGISRRPYQGHQCHLHPLRGTAGKRPGGSDRSQLPQSLPGKYYRCQKDPEIQGCLPRQ